MSVDLFLYTEKKLPRKHALLLSYGFEDNDGEYTFDTEQDLVSISCEPIDEADCFEDTLNAVKKLVSTVKYQIAINFAGGLSDKVFNDAEVYTKALIKELNGVLDTDEYLVDANNKKIYNTPKGYVDEPPAVQAKNISPQANMLNKEALKKWKQLNIIAVIIGVLSLGAFMTGAGLFIVESIVPGIIVFLSGIPLFVVMLVVSSKSSKYKTAAGDLVPSAAPIAIAANPYIDDMDARIAAYDKQNLAALKLLIKPLVKTATLMVCGKEKNVDSKSHLKSCFGGNPYMEEGEELPTYPDGGSIEFMFQVFNDGNNNLPENIKLLQLFCDISNWSGNNTDEVVKIKTYEKLDLKKAATKARPEEHEMAVHCEISFKPIKSLPNFDEIEELYPEIYIIAKQIDNENPWDAYNTAAEQLTGREGESFGHTSHIGGYPEWIQGYDGIGVAKGNEFILQLGSEQNAQIDWGDAGVVHIFYNSKDKKFEFNMECY